MRGHAAYCSYEIALAPLVSARAIPALIALLAAATPEECSYMVHLNATWALYRYCALRALLDDTVVGSWTAVVVFV
jgi:hypothetical protein